MTKRIEVANNKQVGKVNKSFRAQELADIKLETYIKDWQLTDLEKENLTYFFLRKWSGLELADRISLHETGIPVITIWGHDFTPIWQGRKEVWDAVTYSASKGRAALDPINSPIVNYWLSFRGGVCENESFYYVIIQEENSNGRD